MNKYLKKLLSQFAAAKGVGVDQLEVKHHRELLTWFVNYLKSGELYLKWLKEEGLLEDQPCNVAEVGKGEYDTLTINKGTTLISPYSSVFEGLKLDNTILNYDFTVFNGIPLYLGREPFDVVKDIDVFMTQNPYRIMDYGNWHQLYNYGDLDFVFGIYGNIADQDRKAKLDFLKLMKRRLKDDFEIAEMINGDEYYYALSTRLTRFKNKTFN